MHDADTKLKTIEYYRQCKSKTKTCASFSISRQTLDNWIKRHEGDGLGGLVDKSRAHRSHPQKTPAPAIQHIVELALNHPLLGGAALAKLIAPPYRQLSAQTVNGILRKFKLTTVNQRWLALECLLHSKPVVATMQRPWAPFLFERNARYLDYDIRGTAPGEAVAFGVLPINGFAGLRTLSMACVVDTHSSGATAMLCQSPHSVDPVEVVQRATTFYSDLGYSTSRIKIHSKFVSSDSQLNCLRDYLKDRGIGQGTKTEVENMRGWGDIFWSIETKRSGFIIHFDQMARAGFFDLQDRRRNLSLEDLQVRLDDWLVAYNNGAELRGYPTMGKSPMQMIAAARATAGGADRQGDELG